MSQEEKQQYGGGLTLASMLLLSLAVPWIASALPTLCGVNLPCPQPWYMSPFFGQTVSIVLFLGLLTIFVQMCGWIVLRLKNTETAKARADLYFEVIKGLLIIIGVLCSAFLFERLGFIPQIFFLIIPLLGFFYELLFVVGRGITRCKNKREDPLSQHTGRNMALMGSFYILTVFLPFFVLFFISAHVFSVT